ncbi:MAG: histidine phosphatase family protein [Pseudomonadota bacterium]
MGKLIVLSHPEVVVDPSVPIPDWGLNAIGRRRTEAFAPSPVLASVGAVWSSPERKARDTAAILAAHLELEVHIHGSLAENDRSATGFLPPDQFEAAADAFFAAPSTSYRGWETASAAQQRIVGATRTLARAHSEGDLALVTHGAVGTLLWCHLAGQPIDRRFDQPGQGHFWTADLKTLKPDFGWHALT